MRCLALFSGAAILATALGTGRAGGVVPSGTRTRTPATTVASKPAQKAWMPPRVPSRNRARRFGSVNARTQQRVKTGHAAASFEDRTFAIMDSDRDGEIAPREVQAATSRLSGELSSGQRNDTMHKRLSTALTSFDVMRLDLDGDGVLTRREWRGMTASWRESSAKGWKDSAFKFMDTDGDGRATRSERDIALRTLRQLRQETELKADGRDLKDGHRRLVAFLEKTDGEFNVRSFDENKDGVLTLDEFLAGPKIVSKALPSEIGRAYQKKRQQAEPAGNSQASKSMPEKPSRDHKELSGGEHAKPNKDWRKRAFGFLDRNADLVVETHEIDKAHAILRRDKSVGVRLPMEQLWLLRHLDGDDEWQTRADQNGNGDITLDELMAYDSSAPALRDARAGNHATSIEL